MNKFNQRSKYLLIFLSITLGAFVFSQCSDNLTSIQTAPSDKDDINTNSSATGNLIIDITDAPFPVELIAEANITINKIDIRRTVDDTSGDNPFVTLTEKDTTLNLLDLTNGVTTTLVDLEVEADTFDLVRLYISDASISVADTAAGDTTTFAMKVPSGPQTGIKVFIDPPVIVEGGLTTELLLDVDLSKSFIVQGNPNTPAGIKGFIFKPVVRAANQSTAGRINGLVTNSEGDPIEDAEIWVTKADTVFSSTLSDSTGFYALIGLPEGFYNLHGTKTDFDTTTVSDVSVTSGNETTVDLTLTEQ